MNGTNRSVSTKISFPYQFKIIKNERLKDPVIYLSILTRLGMRKIGFLVDSGSDTTVLPLLPYKYWFDFTPNTKEKTTLGGIEGKGVTAYPGKVILQIDKERITVRCFYVESNTMPLLGRLDIWDKYNWLFDNRKNKVVFEKI